MWYVENYENKASLGVKIKEKLVEERTPYQLIEIYETEHFGKLLTLDGLVMLSEKDEFTYHEMMAHPALCAHSNPEHVLIIGGGDGGVVREVLKHPGVKSVTLCEIDERVTRLSQQYLPTVAGQLTDPRVTLIFDDGVKYMEQFENHFDVIMTDSTDPIGPAVGLFTEQYYRSVKKALKSDGIFVCQSESPWVYGEVLTSMTKALCNVFKSVQTYMAEIPLYPPNFTLTFASDAHRLADYECKRAEAIAAQCRYYNTAIQLGASILPTFVEEMVHNQ